MGLPKSLYKKLLIDCPTKVIKDNCSQRVKDVSPLVTNFEKWSDKRRKLYFKDEEEMVVHYQLKNFNLRNNVYGRLLASPMRAEKISKLKSCRELLIPLKVVPSVDNDEHADKNKLKLIPTLDYSKPYKSSYILNSASIVRDNLAAATSWFPISVLQRSTPKCLVVDSCTFLTEYNTRLLEFIKARLSGVPNVGPSSRNRVLLICDKRRTPPIGIQEIKDSDGLPITQSVFNLGYLQAPILEAIMNKDVVAKGIYLDADNDKDLIEHLYSALLFQSGN